MPPSKRGEIMNISRVFVGALATFALAGAGTANAALVEIGASVDQTIGDSDDDGVGDYLWNSDDVFLRVFGTGSVWRGAMEFDISSFSPTDLIASTILNLRDEGTSSDGRIDVYGYTGDGVITTDDASNTGDLVGSLSILNAEGTQDFAVDVTAFIQALVASGENFAGFLLVSESPDFGIGGSDLCSSEGGAGTASAPRPACLGFGPRLDIAFEDDMSAVPLPAALPLFLAGLLGVGAAGRRRRKAA